jgi:DNA-binding transcriptional regulator LsrR (DeoR family)
MTQLEELRLMAKIAHLYYELQMKQADIAAQLDVSQATISRLLKRAEEEKIIRITVSMPAGVYANLEEELRAAYGLKEVIIAHCMQDDDEYIQRAIGAAAAYYVENTLKKNEIIGISSWSSTLLQMVEAMHPLSRKSDAEVVQILGGLGNPEAAIHANRLTERFSRLIHGNARFLLAPGVVGSIEARQILLQDPYVKSVVDLFDHITVAFVGIGAVEPSKMLASSGNIFSSEELEFLKNAGAVGDICLQFYDAHGNPVRTALSDRVIAMSLSQLRHVERTVGIAGGQRKIPALHGALAGKWINVLITDRFTAERLLEGISHD